MVKLDRYRILRRNRNYTLFLTRNSNFQKTPQHTTRSSTMLITHRFKSQPVTFLSPKASLNILPFLVPAHVTPQSCTTIKPFRAHHTHVNLHDLRHIDTPELDTSYYVSLSYSIVI